MGRQDSKALHWGANWGQGREVPTRGVGFWMTVFGVSGNHQRGYDIQWAVRNLALELRQLGPQAAGEATLLLLF